VEKRTFLPLNLQFFADGEGQTEPNQEQANQQDEGAGQTQETHEEKTFTQDELNSFLANEKKDTQSKLLKQLGYDDVNAAKEGLKKLKEMEDAQKSEAEKQADALKSLETEKGSLLDKNTSLEAQLSAMKAGVNGDSVEDVVTLAKPLVGEGVDMDAAIQKVIEKYPHFKGEKQGNEKPNFTTGEFKKQPANEADKWMQAFSAGLPQKNQGGK